MATTNAELAEKVDALTVAVTELAESHANILIIAGTVKDEVGPLLAALQDSPILKMLGVKA